MMRQSAAACIALAALAACRPTAEGRCAQDSDCRTDAVCAPEGICVAVPPSVSVSVTTPNDGAGWFSRSGAGLDILAQVTRDGTDPVSAVLTFANCAASTCTFPGTPVQGGFTFRVPRDVQAVGSAALRMFQVTVTDRAGNAGVGNGVLQIDDAPPAIGNISTVTAGTVGENGTIWFAGGAGRPDVEIAVAVTDPGAGVSSVALHLDPRDVVAGTLLDPPGVPGPGGTVHFQLPVSGMRGEGPMRFSLLATDLLGHASSAPVNSILVDAVAPTVTAPSVNYAAAQPAGVCDASALCGRQSGTHLLRDDVAVLSFDVTDCGVGTASASVVVTGGKTVAASEIGADGAPCTNGNKTHHFQATVDFGDAAPSLPGGDTAGTVLLAVNGTGVDLFGNAGIGAASSGATSGDGIALISLWRWKGVAPGPTTGTPATGSPVLLAGSGPRRVAVGTAKNVTAFGPDGARLWNANVTNGVGADLARSPTLTGPIYAVSPRGSCGGSCSGTLTQINSSSGAVTPCSTITGASFGAPPAITTVNTSPTATAEAAIVAATDHVGGLFPVKNLYVYTGCSVASSSVFTPSGNEMTGVSAAANRAFFSHAAGITTQDQSGPDFVSSTQANFNSSVPVFTAPAAMTMQKAFFGTFATDQKLYTAVYKTSCSPGVPQCWIPGTGFPVGPVPSGLPFTPLFDDANIYTVDATGNVTAYSQSGGAQTWTRAAGGSLSAPVLLQDGSLLAIQVDGSVKLFSGTSPSAGDVLLQTAPYATGVPAAPAVDVRGAFGVAYVSDGAGAVWAIEVRAPPALASATVWPRPGRDSCNSRNSGSACQ